MTKRQSSNTPVSLYINLTYACNSACVFCASVSPNIKIRRDIPMENILEAYDDYQIGAGDEVILNGGEPSIYRDLPTLIQNASQRQAKVILFTNGRLLQKRDYAERLLKAGVFRLTIPLHGRFSITHDSLTGRPGSLSETLSGIRNAYSIRAVTGYPNQIELKLLTVRSALQEWPDIVDFIAEEFGCPDILVMSGLHMWSTARDLYNQISPTFPDLHCYVNQALERAIVHKMQLVLWSIPLCILSEKNLNQFKDSVYRDNKGQLVDIQSVYFDPDSPRGIELPDDGLPEYSDIETTCQDCVLFEDCGPGSMFMQQILAVSSNNPSVIGTD